MKSEKEKPSLWEFAVQLYSSDGVKGALLSLQEEDNLDIPYFLFTLWSGCYYRRIPANELNKRMQACSELSRNLVHPIRRSRCWVKANLPESESLYRQLLDAELACEKRLINKLENGFLQADSPGQYGKEQGIRNAEDYLAAANISVAGENKKRLAIVFKQFNQLPAPDNN